MSTLPLEYPQTSLKIYIKVKKAKIVFKTSELLHRLKRANKVH